METYGTDSRRISRLESHLGYWLRRVSNAVSGEFARALQAKQTSVAEWVFLRELCGRGQATPGEMASALGLTRGAVSKVIDKLEAKRWLESEGKEGDDRVRLLRLTRGGHHNLPLLAKIADENDAHFFDCLTGREKRTLHELLARIAERTDIHKVPID